MAGRGYIDLLRCTIIILRSTGKQRKNHSLVTKTEKLTWVEIYCRNVPGILQEGHQLK